MKKIKNSTLRRKIIYSLVAIIVLCIFTVTNYYYYNFSDYKNYLNNGTANEYMKDFFKNYEYASVTDANGNNIKENFKNDTKGFFEYVHQNKIEISYSTY